VERGIRIITPRNHTDLLLGEAGVNDKDDTVDGQRSLGDVGGHNDLAANGAWPAVFWRRVENALLLAVRV
jgi:hypothetical protein